MPRPLHRQVLFSDAARRTSLTRAFSGRLARSIHNEFIEALQGQGTSLLPPYPVQNWLTAQLRAAALAAGRTDVISLWSGQSAPLLKHRRAAELIARRVARYAPCCGPTGRFDPRDAAPRLSTPRDARAPDTPRSASP